MRVGSNALRMIRIFEVSEYHLDMGYWWPSDVFEHHCAELKGRAFELEATRPGESVLFPTVTEFLESNSSPDWLVPLPPRILADLEAKSSWTCRTNVVGLENMKQFQTMVNEIGLSLPGSFVSFMTDTDLRARFPFMYSATEFFYSYLELTKIISFEDNINGYVCQFYEDNLYAAALSSVHSKRFTIP
jgi:hypothetical protein